MRHGIRFSFCVSITAWAFHVNPFRDVRKWRFSSFCRLEILNNRKCKRKLFFRYRNHSALFTVNYRNWLSPVSLPVEGPVFHLIVDLFAAKIIIAKILNHFFNCILNLHSIYYRRVDHYSICNISISLFLYVSAADYLNYRNIKFFRKFPVSLVVSWNRHNRSSSIPHHYIVRNPHWYFFSRNRIYGLYPFKLNTGLVLSKLNSFKFCFLFGFILIILNLIHIAYF